MDIKQRIEEIYPELVEVRRDFHRHPEPGFEEKWTSARIRELLDGWGISYEYPVAGTGIAAMIQGSSGLVVGDVDEGGVDALAQLDDLRAHLVAQLGVQRCAAGIS